MTEPEGTWKVETYVDKSPTGFALAALDKGMPVEQLEKMLELQLRWESNEARKAYLEAMAEAQEQMPVVPRKAKNQQTNSMYARYEDVMVLAKPIYTKGGFSITFYEEDSPKEKYVRICADVMHRSGHMEQRHVDVPMDDVGIKGTTNKTQTHAKKSSISYGKGMLLCMIFNIPTGEDVDDDGNAAGGSLNISEDQAKEIEKLLDETKADRAKFFEWVGVATVQSIPLAKFGAALSLLNAKKRKTREPGQEG